jgi:hypothetical protein
MAETAATLASSGSAPVAEANRALVEEAVRQGGVATERPSPGIAEYGAELAAALEEVVRTLAEAVGGAVPDNFLVGCLGFFFVLTVLLVFWLLLRIWLKRRKPAAAVELAPASAAPPLPPGADWEGEVERRLASGEVHGALEALWWWLAGRLEAPAAEASWTTRELVQRAGRRDLLRLVMPLDRLLYGAGQPSTGEVRGLFETLRGALPMAEPAG